MCYSWVILLPDISSLHIGEGFWSYQMKITNADWAQGDDSRRRLVKFKGNAYVR